MWTVSHQLVSNFYAPETAVLKELALYVTVTGCTQRKDSAIFLLLLSVHHLVSSETCLLLFHLHTHQLLPHNTTCLRSPRTA